ncbi:ArsR/SmtB family transcription factor [Furfurilactobacillus sp. WILCCON 0119]
MVTQQQLDQARTNFSACQPMLVALGDEARQAILLTLIGTTCAEGLRVGDITAAVNLSRPAVSHHLKLLKDSGLVNVRKQGTMNFYSVDIRTNFAKLKGLVEIIETLKEDPIHD